jgi:hypothetical protein
MLATWTGAVWTLLATGGGFLPAKALVCQTLGGAVAAYTNTKRVVQWYDDLSTVVPTQGYILWLLVGSITHPLERCIKLNKRAMFLRYVNDAVKLTRNCLRRCEDLLAREDETDGRPDKQEGWTQWMKKMKDGTTRAATLPKLIAELHVCYAALQLGISLIAELRSEKPRSMSSSVFEYNRIAVEDDAYGIKMEIEMGRIEEYRLAVGQVHKHSVSSVERGGLLPPHNWQALGPKAVALALRTTITEEDVVLLKLTSAERSNLDEVSNLDEDGDDDEDDVCSLVINSSFSIIRITPDVSLPAEMSANAPTDGSELMYLLRGTGAIDGVDGGTVIFDGEFEPEVTVLLEFESANGISAEVFEALLFMIVDTNGRSRQLSETVDFDSPEEVQAWATRFAKAVGSFDPKDVIDNLFEEATQVISLTTSSTQTMQLAGASPAAQVASPWDVAVVQHPPVDTTEPGPDLDMALTETNKQEQLQPLEMTNNAMVCMSDEQEGGATADTLAAAVHDIERVPVEVQEGEGRGDERRAKETVEVAQLEVHSLPSALPTMEEVKRENMQLKAQNAHLVADNCGLRESNDNLNALLCGANIEVQRLGAEVQSLTTEYTDTLRRNSGLAEEVAVLKRELRAASGHAREEEVGGLSPEFEELRAKFELLEQMFQPVQTENEQRKAMLADTRKLALEISRSRQDLDIPTKRMGELDNVHLHQLGVSTEETSLLQDQMTNPNFHPWRVMQQHGRVETVANWADEQLQTIVQKYDSCSGGRGRAVAEEVLRCHKDLQQWNPSGGYCVTIPYHHGEQRELKPEELLKIAVGISVAGCRTIAGVEASRDESAAGGSWSGPGAAGSGGAGRSGGYGSDARGRGRGRGYGGRQQQGGEGTASWSHVAASRQR